ncbi:putative transcription factor NAM family [Arabidopsis thaliana]
MMKDPTGYRFSPTGEEVINHYLKNKILGKTWLVDEAISEINILNHKPSKDLPKLARIQSEDLEWYFFSPIEYTNPNKMKMKRTTGSGFWKPSGVDRKLGIKEEMVLRLGLRRRLCTMKVRVLMELELLGLRTSITSLACLMISLNMLSRRKYVVCQVKYKGEAAEISYEPSPSLVSDSHTVIAINGEPEPELQVEQPGKENLLGMSVDDLIEPMNQQEEPQGPHLAPNDDEFIRGLRHVDREPVEYLFANEENMDGLSIMNDLTIPMIAQQEDLILSEWEGFIAATFFSDNNNNNNLNVHQLTSFLPG